MYYSGYTNQELKPSTDFMNTGLFLFNDLPKISAHDMSAGLIPIECSQSTLPTLNTYAQSAYISTRTPQHPTGSKTHPILLLMFTTE